MISMESRRKTATISVAADNVGRFVHRFLPILVGMTPCNGNSENSETTKIRWGLMRTIGVGNHDSDSLDGENLVLGNITAIPRTRGQ